MRCWPRRAFAESGVNEAKFARPWKKRRAFMRVAFNFRPFESGKR